MRQGKGGMLLFPKSRYRSRIVVLEEMTPGALGSPSQ